MSNKYSYQSFCWVVGTTSFRTAKLNLKIEQQLLLLDEFYKIILKDSIWNWNNALQEKYYDFMKGKKFLYGEAKRKDKDAREITSGLVDIGLLTTDRLITEAGRELLCVTNDAIFSTDNIFNIYRDSFVYLKQLLKTAITVNGNIVRPFLLTIKSLLELDYLTYDEFTYLIPLINDKKSFEEVIENIRLYRKNKIGLKEIIYKRLISMANYKLAFLEFVGNEVSEDLICLIGMNRKSRNYDKQYFELYQEIKNVFIKHENKYENLFIATMKINQNLKVLWKNLLFKTNSISIVKKNKELSISSECPFLNCSNEKELKKIFFKYLHVFKAMATLKDYFDLNRRYFNITDILVFEDDLIKLDILPKYYFKEAMKESCVDVFAKCDKLACSTSLIEISQVFDVDVDKIYLALSEDLGVKIKTLEQALRFINNERFRRFNILIDKKFNDSVLIELLNCFERRDDKRIEELVTDEATIPTIFEYILGIIWYKISERQGDILDFMKLSLESNLLPKSHALGGYADIIYEYEECNFYPKHSLLLEATLTDKNNQRRMEMEPVSRHLGDYRIKFNNIFDYSLFISIHLDKNVISDFRYRKIIPYTRNEKTITGMKIISLDTNSLKKILENKIKYRHLYEVFEKYHRMPLKTMNWHDEMIKEATEGTSY